MSWHPLDKIGTYIWNREWAMSYARTTAESLAQVALTHLDAKVTYPPIATDGAERAAQIIAQLL
jgi:hypothetical protein